MNGAVALKKSKSYTDLAQLGLFSIETKGLDIILTRTDNSKAVVSVPAPADGISITNVSVNASKELVITFSDGSTKVAGVVPTVKGDPGEKGDDGVSPTITENANNTDKIYKLDITTADTTFTTPNLKGADGTGGSGGSGEENVIESIKVNGVVQTVAADKSVDITVPEAYDDSSLVQRVSNIESDYAKSSDIPSLSGYATEDYVAEQIGNIPSVDLTDYAKKDEIPDVSGFITEIPAEYVTETELEAKGYLTEHQDISELENKSHEHNNKTVIDKIVSDGIGSGFLADNGEYINILHIDTTSPSYDSQIWIDITTSTPILKIYDGADWVAVSGGSGDVGVDIDDSDVSSDKCWSSYKTNSMLLKSISIDSTTKTITVTRNDDTTIESDITDFITGIINGLNYGNAKYCESIPTVAQDVEGNWIATYVDKSDSTTKTCNALNTWFYYDVVENSETYTAQTLFVDGQELTLKAGSIGNILSIDPDTKHWIIQGLDSGIKAEGEKGETGTSISSVSVNDDKHLIITYSDNTIQDVGLLKFDIQGDFLTEDGFGNLRYYNGHFQYYDTVSSTWIDTSVTPSNVYVMNMTPQEMKSIFGVYDTDLGKYKLKFEEPDDTIIDGQVACVVEKVIIRRKLGSAPTSETDGDLVLEVKRKDFGSYKNEYFVDTVLSPSIGEIYFYKAFPMSTTGFYNSSTANETDGIKCKNYNLYGFKLDQNESDPASMITYLSDCDNKYYKSAKMNYATDTFDYGDWGDVWFIKNLKPCMLKYDGTVDYELDKDDYAKKTDGTASDVADSSYGGNAMVGIPKVYWKVVNNGDNTANIYFSDKQVDTDFHCWSHIDNNGAEIDYCYMPIYNGSNVNSVLRSISGKTPIYNQTANTEITYAKANNTGSDIIWYTELFNDRMLINLLLLLIGKSTDTQTVFGAGNNNSYVSTSNTGVKNTGTMNTKGLFWGNQDNKSGVKVFGMEHWWGNQWRRIGGWINDKGTQKIKMTYGQSDGSTVDGYNTDGSGYITIINSTPSGTTGGYISKMLITNNGLIPTIASGSATTYYCDGLWLDNSQVNYALVGSSSFYASRVGALCAGLYALVSVAGWGIGAALSCKPLATT